MFKKSGGGLYDGKEAIAAITKILLYSLNKQKPRPSYSFQFTRWITFTLISLQNILDYRLYSIDAKGPVCP